MAAKYLPALIAVVRVAWSILKEFGLNGALVGAISASIIGKLAMVEQLPTIVLAVIVMMSFTSVMIIWTFFRVYLREYRDYPRYEEWRKVDPIAIWQAACLWVEKEPRIPIIQGSKAYPSFQMLKSEMHCGDLTPVAPLPRDDESASWSRVWKRDLKSLTERKNLGRPKFLFPD